MSKVCNQVHEVVNTPTGEILYIIQSDVMDLTSVIVRDFKGVQSRQKVSDLVCKNCRGNITVGDGLSLFFCPSMLEVKYK
jgi:hypothetical protein